MFRPVVFLRLFCLLLFPVPHNFSFEQVLVLMTLVLKCRKVSGMSNYFPLRQETWVQNFYNVNFPCTLSYPGKVLCYRKFTTVLMVVQKIQFIYKTFIFPVKYVEKEIGLLVLRSPCRESGSLLLMTWVPSLYKEGDPGDFNDHCTDTFYTVYLVSWLKSLPFSNRKDTFIVYKVSMNRFTYECNPVVLYNIIKSK